MKNPFLKLYSTELPFLEEESVVYNIHRSACFLLVFAVFVAFSNPVDAGSRDDFLVENWYFAPFNDRVGQAGVEVVVSPDGIPEILTSLAANELGRIQRCFGTSEYDIAWRSGLMETPAGYDFEIERLFYREMKALGWDIALLLNDYYYRLMDYQNGTVLNTFQIEDFFDAADVADFDGDGDPDLFLLYRSYPDDSIHVYDVDSGTMLWDVTVNARCFTVGQFDDDPQNELIYSLSHGETGGRVIDLQTFETEWETGVDFGEGLLHGDVDRDGRDELIVFREDWIGAFDIDTKQQKWQVVDTCDKVPFLLDIENDGALELIYNDWSRIGLVCISAADGSELWTQSNMPISYITDVTAADIDLDGANELICAVQMYGRRIYIIDHLSRDIEWKNLNQTDGFTYMDAADIDSDGVTEIILGFRETNHGYDGGVVHVIDAVTHRIEQTHKIQDNDPLQVLFVEELAASSPGREIALSIGSYYGMLHVKDALTYEDLWATEYEITHAIPVDMDRDGALEILAAGRHPDVNYEDCLILFDGETGHREWETEYFGSWVDDLAAGDIDMDGVIEIGYAMDDHLIILDGQTRSQEWTQELDFLHRLIFADLLPGEPGIEILAAYDDETVGIFSGTDYQLLNSFTVGNRKIAGLQACDIDSDGTPELVVSSDDDIYCLTSDGTQLWSSSLRGHLEYPRNIICRDINADGVNELLINTDFALTEFRCGGASGDPMPPCNTTGVTLDLPIATLTAGDGFQLDAYVCNTSNAILYDHHVFILLDVFGEYWCLPSWIGTDTGIDSYQYSIPPGRWPLPVVPAFLWPTVQGAVNGVMFWGAILDPEMTGLVGEMGHVAFGWQ